MREEDVKIRCQPKNMPAVRRKTCVRPSLVEEVRDRARYASSSYSRAMSAILLRRVPRVGPARGPRHAPSLRPRPLRRAPGPPEPVAMRRARAPPARSGTISWTPTERGRARGAEVLRWRSEEQRSEQERRFEELGLEDFFWSYIRLQARVDDLGTELRESR